MLLTTFTVNTLADATDAIDGNGIAADSTGRTTLRSAVREANLAEGHDIIQLLAGSYRLTVGHESSIGENFGDLDIKDTLTIAGLGANQTTIDAGFIDRAFQIRSGATLKLIGVGITNGNAELGAGIRVRNGGTLVLIDSRVVDNNGIGIYSQGSSNSVTLTNSTIAGNQDSGLVNRGGSVTITSSEISQNTADRGGGIFSLGGSITVEQSTISGNVAEFTGGGAYVYNSTLNVVDSTITGNSASYRGGGVFSRLSHTDISGSTISSNVAATGGGLSFIANIDAEVEGSTVSGNSAQRGAGVEVLRGLVHIDGSDIKNNSAQAGGGIAVLRGGELQLTDTSVSQNDARRGGGLFAKQGDVDVCSSALFGNSASLIGGAVSAIQQAKIDFQNATVSNNTAIVAAGISAHHGTQIEVSQSTVFRNVAQVRGGGLRNRGGHISLVNSIVAGNTGVFGPDLTGDEFVSLGHNLIGDTREGSGFHRSDILNVDPMLDPQLKNNGGATPTHALMAGSPAIDSGVETDLNDIDQRGQSRFQDGRLRPDIGAYEATFVVDEMFIDVDQLARDGIQQIILRRGTNSQTQLDQLEIIASNAVIDSLSYQNFGRVRLTGTSALDIVVDYSNGDPLPMGGIRADRSAMNSNGPQLRLVGGSLQTIRYDFAANLQMISLDGKPVQLPALSLIRDQLQAVDRLFIFADDTDDTVTLSDNSSATDGMSRLTSEGSSVSIDFLNPTGSLTIRGGGGDDVIHIDGRDSSLSAAVEVFGNDGDDLIDGDGFSFAFAGFGGPGEDRLIGGRSHDTLRGHDGDDTLDGRDGNDSLVGNNGDDQLIGGTGQDVLVGDYGNDHLFGGSHNDLLAGDVGNDVLIGGSGDDVLHGGHDDDQLTGDAGRDLLIGGDGHDLIDGNANEDISIATNTPYGQNLGELSSLLRSWTVSPYYSTPHLAFDQVMRKLRNDSIEGSFTSLEFGTSNVVGYYQGSDTVHDLYGVRGFGTQTRAGFVDGARIIAIDPTRPTANLEFKHALSLEGPRIIYFTKSGILVNDDRIHITNGDLSILGPEAGVGVELRGYMLVIRASNVFMSDIKVRPGNGEAGFLGIFDGRAAAGRYPTHRIPNFRRKGIVISSDHTQGVENVVLHRVTVTDATDGSIAVFRDGQDAPFLRNITIDRSYMGRVLSAPTAGSPGYAALELTQGEFVSVTNNVIASANKRLPKINAHAKIFMANNVTYNAGKYAYQFGSYSTSKEPGPIHANIINNYYRTGSLGAPLMFTLQTTVAPTSQIALRGNVVHGATYDPNDPNNVGINMPIPDSAVLNTIRSSAVSGLNLVPAGMDINQLPSAAATYQDLVVHGNVGSRSRTPYDLQLIRNVQHGDYIQTGANRLQTAGGGGLPFPSNFIELRWPGVPNIGAAVPSVLNQMQLGYRSASDGLIYTGTVTVNTNDGGVAQQDEIVIANAGNAEYFFVPVDADMRINVVATDSNGNQVDSVSHQVDLETDELYIVSVSTGIGASNQLQVISDGARVSADLP